MDANRTDTAGPDFICIGPKRTATTWLADHLKLHTDIWLTPIQELNYLRGTFTEHYGKPRLDLRWTRWEIVKRIVRNKSLSTRADREFLALARRLARSDDVDLPSYRQLFAPARGRFSGDISPMYASFSAVEIARAMPVLDEARVFMIARDPVKRFWSDMSLHAHSRILGDVDYGSVETARRFFLDAGHQKQHLLSGIVQRWRDGIGDRLRIFYFDDIARDPSGSLRDIVSYIGADFAKRLRFVGPAFNRKAQTTKLIPSAEARRWVRHAFQDELRDCEAMFGQHGARWRAEHAGVA